MVLRIAVCLKQVPDDSARLVVRPDGRGLQEDQCAWMLSPFDRYAIEEALRIRAREGGECVGLHVGPDRAPSVIMEGLALGLDSAVQAWGDGLGDLDALGIARVLAAMVRAQGPFDLVLTGQRGVGEDQGQTPALLASLLDWPEATLAIAVRLDARRARIVREVEGAQEEWEVDLPAVISAQKGLNEPRQKSLKGVLEAKKKPVRRLNAADLGLSAGELSARLSRTEIVAAPPRKPVRWIEGPPEAQARELVRLLRAEGRL
jgi:electron transfer flavoprotein beta subunit